MKARKKPVVIEYCKASEAIKNAGHNWKELPTWLAEAYEKGEVMFAHQHVDIRTLEGVMKADLGDYIIRGVLGEIYPCKPDIFEMTYDKICEHKNIAQGRNTTLCLDCKQVNP